MAEGQSQRCLECRSGRPSSRPIRRYTVRCTLLGWCKSHACLVALVARSVHNFQPRRVRVLRWWDLEWRSEAIDGNYIGIVWAEAAPAFLRHASVRLDAKHDGRQRLRIGRWRILDGTSVDLPSVSVTADSKSAPGSRPCSSLGGAQTVP